MSISSLSFFLQFGTVVQAAPFDFGVFLTREYLFVDIPDRSSDSTMWGEEYTKQSLHVVRVEY